MKDLLPIIEQWTESGKPFAISTVIKTWGSSPRPVGSSMIVNAEGDMAGSVSGGCVEGAVVKESSGVIESGLSKRLNYGVSDDDAWAVGLSCGGSIRVFTEPFNSIDDDIRSQLLECLKTNVSCVLASRVADDQPLHTLFVYRHGQVKVFGASPSDELTAFAAEAYTSRKHNTVEIGDDAFFLRVFPRRSQMLIIGAAHVTTHLVDLGALFDFETVVIDPRGAFAQRTQFNTAPDRIIESYPAEVLKDFDLDPYTYAVILSHDPKIDDNALQVLLPSNVAYIGALGSKKTHAKRVARLEAAGFTTGQIERIHAPIGLSINARTPMEIAMSIMAQIIEVKNSGA